MLPETVSKDPMNNALLAYILYSMQSGTAEKIKSIVCTHFAIDDVITAKDMLWDATDQSIIGPEKRSRDGTIKSEKHSHSIRYNAQFYGSRLHTAIPPRRAQRNIYGG